jgi:hypothetical protein
MFRPIALETLALLASLSAAGCIIPWSTSSEDKGGGGTTCRDVEPSTGSSAAVVPPKPKGTPAPDPGATVLAISQIAYGDTDANGLPSQNAWKQIGLNIDGKVTSTCATDVCTLVGGATNTTQLDGDNGIDNSFGENFLPVMDTLYSAYTSDANQALTKGDPTMLLQLDGTGADPSYAPLPGALYRAAPSAAAPRWDGSDVRDVDTVSLVGGSLSQPLAVVSGGYMTQRTWVGAPSTGTAYLDMHFTVNGYPMPPLPIEHLQIVTQVAADGGTATGTLAGVVRTSDFVAWAHRWAYVAGWSSLCTASALDSVTTQIEQMSDIMADGSNGPGQQCDGISVGLGFQAVAVKLGQARTLPPPPLPRSSVCDGGVAGE